MLNNKSKNDGKTNANCVNIKKQNQKSDINARPNNPLLREEDQLRHFAMVIVSIYLSNPNKFYNHE